MQQWLAALLACKLIDPKQKRNFVMAEAIKMAGK
jgi:hypothetical protein